MGMCRERKCGVGQHGCIFAVSCWHNLHVMSPLEKVTFQLQPAIAMFLFRVPPVLDTELSLFPLSF